MITDFTSKNIKMFSCDKCNFYCSKKGDFNRHLTTTKHKMITNDNEITSKNITPTICNCGKKYKYASGLSRHIKICSYIKETENINKELVTANVTAIVPKEPDNTRALLDVIAQNKDLMDLLKEQSKNVDKLTKTVNEMIPKIGNTTNNTNNFNLNVFLNEDCKDALNIMDFVKSLQIQIEDLVTTGKLGFAESTSQLLIKNLNELEVTKRPIHCSDLKRETLYIKDNDVWEKETENKDTMKRAVKYLQKESFGVIPDWVKEHPGCARGDNQHNDEYMEIVGNTAGVDNVKDVNKIVKKVAKEVIIDKKNI